MLDKLLASMLPSARGTENAISEEKAIVAEGVSFSPYFIPNYRAAEKILSVAKVYDGLEKSVPGYKLLETRSQFLT